jgi:hypothetical protein
MTELQERIQGMLEDLKVFFNHLKKIEINEDNISYESLVMLVIDRFHTEIYTDENNYFDWYSEITGQNIPILDFNDFIELERVTEIDILRMYHWLLFDNFYVEERQRIRLGRQFMRSELKEELMSVVWHPNNFHKFVHLDPDTFLL